MNEERSAFPVKQQGVISKSEICRSYGISSGTLRRLLNEKYLAGLQELGYQTHQVYLSPRQYQYFTQMYGEP